MLQSSAGPHHLITQEVICLTTPLIFPCSHAFLIHASTSCLINAALILLLASLQYYLSTAAHRERCRLGKMLTFLGCFVLRGTRSQLEACASFLLPQHRWSQDALSNTLLHTLSWSKFHSPSLLRESGHMCSRQVSCLLSLKHQ